MDATIATPIKQISVGIHHASSGSEWLAKKKISLVEQMSDWDDVLVLLIRRSGYELVEASTRLKALDEATAVTPDWISGFPA